MSSSAPSVLMDRFGRRVTYLRLSITDRCDFRCVYCMAEHMEFLPRAQILTLEEIARVARAFVALGVNKIRVTGGEPLVRRGVLELLEDIGRLPGLKDLAITTNGSQLVTQVERLRSAGVGRVNISLDTLDAARFRDFTRTGNLDAVLDGIEAARQAGFARIKINSVMMRGKNHDEAPDLVAFAVQRGLDVSFIEEMPLGQVDGHDRRAAFYSGAELRRDLKRQFTLLPTPENTGGPSRYWRVAGTDTRVGFITPHSHNFCASCNRVRVTAEGRLLLCLGNEHSVDLRRVLRAYPSDDARLKRTVVQAMAIKPERHHFALDAEPVIFRHMNATGG